VKIKIDKLLEFKDWDFFVESSNSGTIFHKLKFLSYHNKNLFHFNHLAFKIGRDIIAVLPGSLEKGVFKSPAGASFGSFVVKKNSFKEYEEIVDSFIDYCKYQKIKKIILTPPPICYLNNPSQIEDYMLLYKGFKLEKSVVTTVLELNQPNNNSLLAFISPSFKKAVKQSYKFNLKVNFSTDFKAFYKILLKNKKKFNAQPTHTLDEIIKLNSLFPNDIKLLMAFYKSKAIGGLLLFSCNLSCLMIFYICSDYEYQQTRVVNKLLYESIVWAKKKGYRYLDFGISPDTFSQNPMEPSRSLISFKEGTGGRTFLRNTYCLDLNK